MAISRRRQSVRRKKLTVDFAGGNQSSAGGLLLLREAERKLGVCRRLAEAMPDRRDPDRVRHAMFEMVMARASAIACGYEDAIDLDRLRHDPLMKVAVGRCPQTGAPLASQSTISRLENAPSKTEAGRLSAALLDQFGATVKPGIQFTGGHEFGFVLGMLPPTDLDGLSHADLKSLVLKLLEEAAELRRTVAAQRDEIARLKGGPGRPNIKPSGMDKATEPRPPPPTGSEPRQKGGKTSKLSIHEERTVTVAAPPQGSRFKGYTNFVVQDLVIRSHVVNFRRERWQKPDGDMMTAPLPAGISGHFGPELRRFVLAQYHQGQMTVPRLLAQLRAFGIVISKRQLVRLLIAGQDGFLAENREVLRAGLSSAAWVTVDDTGARHKAANGFCTQIGNAHFVWFGTTASKSRLNFLHLLRAGHSDYVINTEALDYMRQRALSSPVIARLAEHPQRFFTSQVAWTAHLDRLGISALEVNPDPVMVATEGALWGSVKSHGFLPDTVIVSDDAGRRMRSADGAPAPLQCFGDRKYHHNRPALRWNLGETEGVHPSVPRTVTLRGAPSGAVSPTRLPDAATSGAPIRLTGSRAWPSSGEAARDFA